MALAAMDLSGEIGGQEGGWKGGCLTYKTPPEKGNPPRVQKRVYDK